MPQETNARQTDADGLVKLISASFRDNWDINAMSDLAAKPLKYSQIANRIAANHLMFERAGIRHGDRVAVCGKNSTNWAVAFLSALTYGAVTVPILHEFHYDSIHHLVSHSGAKLLYIDFAIWDHLDPEQMPELDGVIDVEKGDLLMSRSETLADAYRNIDGLFGKAYPEGLDADGFYGSLRDASDDDLAVINYTSGSTGLSKGVMLTYRNLWSNAKFATDNIPYLHPGDGMVSMLPLAHMFGMLVELIFPLLKGCHITFLGRVPSPKILLDTFAEVHPKIVVTVPLVIEKIVKNRIMPALDKPLVKLLAAIPLASKTIYRKINSRMTAAFGGNLQQLIIGGAALSPAVESLLRRIRFPYTVGYGMTECAPLISYCRWDLQKPGSCGRIVDRMEARIDSPDPASVPGVLWVKGDNVMRGYYKNKEATEAVFDNGWMNTGDICTLDQDGFLFIRGRDKSMILGASGQNIYPEEIENKLNNLPFVGESVVIERDGKIIALVYPDFDAAEKASVSKEKIDQLMDYNLTTLNRSLPSYSKVAQIRLQQTPFEKTPKHSIKRYLYQ